jgi:Phospholipid methyltransferase
MDRYLAAKLRPQIRLTGTGLGPVSGLLYHGDRPFLIVLCGVLLSACGFGEPGQRLFPKEFIAIGPFRYVRNPMSIGAIMAMLGWSMVNRSLSMFLAWLLLTLLLHLVVVCVEEPGLEKCFGASYRAYRSSVPRWLPRFTKP